MTRYVLIFFLCCISLFGAHAQNRTITGTVISAENDKPLAGVTIGVSGTATSTQTDENGRYSIIVSAARGKIAFSNIGFIPQTIQLTQSTELNVRLTPESNYLEEAVVTGYGTQRRGDITGAIATVNPKAIENMPVQSFDRALQGQASGVQINASSGVPGASVQMRIRGTGSIAAGNEPLYIVDGVQINSNTSTSFVNSNPLAFLNTNDIESISVLKDAAASAIYGAQAANGVVLITTKKGKSGKGQINFNSYLGWTEPMPQVNMMNSQQYVQARKEAIWNRNPNRSEEENRNAWLDALVLPRTTTDAEIAALPTYNWQDEAFRSGKNQNYELSFSGGNERTKVFLSGSYNNQEGAVIGIDFKRATVLSNISHKPLDWLTVELNANLSTVTQNGAAGSSGSTGAFAAPQYAAPMMLPYIPIFNEDGSYNAPPSGLPGDMTHNSIFATSVNTIKSNTRALVGNTSFTAQILPGLTFKSFYGLDYRTIASENYRDPRTVDGFARNGLLELDNYENINFLTNQTFNYNTHIDEIHSLSALLGFEYRNDARDYRFMSGEGFPTFQFSTMQSAATPLNTTGSWTGFKTSGAFGQVNYDFDKRYFVSAVLRYDGSSRFGANNRYGLFPGISAAWAIDKENFMHDITWIDQLKLRASYGHTGNANIDNFAWRALYIGLDPYNAQPGIRPSGIANPDLRWERNITTNLGLDIGLFNGRISTQIEVFRRISHDLLLNRPLPYTSGYQSTSSNLGKLENKGLEITLNTTNIQVKDFSWTTNFNVSFIRNKVLSLYDGLEVLPGNQSVRVGYPLGSQFYGRYAGVNAATGKAMWYDADGNITYSLRNPLDYAIQGNSMSDSYGGFTNTLNYKGIELSAFFQYDLGRLLYNSQNTFWYRNGATSRNTLADIYERRWQEPGDITSVPRPIDTGAELGGMASGYSSSTRFLEDASYIRLKNISIGYSLPAALVSKIGARQLRVYAQGVNLITWTKWTGYDPEFSSTGTNAELGTTVQGSTQGMIPPLKSYTFGVQIGF
ncbi:TonB-dependent receptor [Sphingobacterium oryzagri]|uniref:TonB-dependent receptor n=1 Tax=Sphingobacterium oryzagri TaxID=3025669 RepID=A0ABY7WIF3_9SPHI|nr:TonB-dependent receptor [Sphingobacterium sp. KACC 22765]WDF69397.1 TonB-dependent receptor [Sphingobacterium sp. KACC 22765]